MGSEATAVQHLLDEAQAAAVERALDPVVLQPAVLEKLLPAGDGSRQ